MGIVKILRAYATDWRERAKSNAVVLEAADEIERLRYELSEEKGIVADLLSENKRLADLVIAYRLSEADEC